MYFPENEHVLVLEYLKNYKQYITMDRNWNFFCKGIMQFWLDATYVVFGLCCDPEVEGHQIVKNEYSEMRFFASCQKYAQFLEYAFKTLIFKV